MRRSRLLWLLLALPLLYGCTKPKPPKPPEPPVEPQTGRPASVIGSELQLSQSGGRLQRGGAAFARVGAIPCWPTDGTGDRLIVEGRQIPYLWPLVSPEWIEYAAGKGANFFHVRPYFGQVCCGLEPTGGPFKPDGSDNPAFWEVFHKAGRAAVAAKAGLEVDCRDGWVDKHCIAGDFPCPLDPERGVPLSSGAKRWVQKVVYESCNYANVTFQISNEGDLTPGWTAAWERAMRDEIRSAEQQQGCGGTVHMIGTNTRDVSGPYDYVVSHNPNEALAPVDGHPMVVNEYNPHLSPATFGARAAEAKSAAQGFDYWRSDGSDQDQTDSLGAINSAAVYSCPDPKPNAADLWFQFGNGCPDNCDTTPTIKNYPYCLSIGMGEMGGQPRANCPVRNECGPTGAPVPGDPTSFQCDQRLRCEQFVMQAPHPVFLSDGKVTPLDANGFRVRCEGCTWLRACDASLEHCSEKAF